MVPMPFVMVEVICARVTLERAEVVKEEAEPPCLLTPWQRAQLAEYKAIGSMVAAGVVADAVLETAELPAELKAKTR